jgi:formyltetrahydrofolate deformylase
VFGWGFGGECTVGRDAEALALARAVRWHCQSRVLLNGHSTVVFR